MASYLDAGRVGALAKQVASAADVRALLREVPLDIDTAPVRSMRTRGMAVQCTWASIAREPGQRGTVPSLRKSLQPDALMTLLQHIPGIPGAADRSAALEAAESAMTRLGLVDHPGVRATFDAARLAVDARAVRTIDEFHGILGLAGLRSATHATTHPARTIADLPRPLAPIALRGLLRSINGLPLESRWQALGWAESAMRALPGDQQAGLDDLIGLAEIDVANAMEAAVINRISGGFNARVLSFHLAA